MLLRALMSENGWRGIPKWSRVGGDDRARDAIARRVALFVDSAAREQSHDAHAVAACVCAQLHAQRGGTSDVTVGAYGDQSSTTAPRAQITHLSSRHTITRAQSSSPPPRDVKSLAEHLNMTCDVSETVEDDDHDARDKHLQLHPSLRAAAAARARVHTLRQRPTPH
jgi:hypothetical protein